MNKTIQFYKKSVWGNTHYYIAAHLGADMQEIAQNVQRLTGQKTLSAWHQKALINLGFSFVEVIAPE